MNIDDYKNKFKSDLRSAISEGCIKASAADGKISYNDGKTIANKIRAVFAERIGYTPDEVNAACNFSLAFIAPSHIEKITLLKGVVAIAGTTGGLAAIIAGIGVAAGWGAGVVAAVTAWFCGAAIAGPIAWIASGVALVAIASYFYFSSSDATVAEQFEKTLIAGIDRAIDQIWESHCMTITKTMQKHNGAIANA